MRHYKTALALLSPYLIYTLTKKAEPHYVAAAIETSNPGVHISCDTSQKLNKFLLKSKLIELIQTYNPPLFSKITQLSLAAGMYYKDKEAQITFQRKHIVCEIKGSYSVDMSSPSEVAQSLISTNKKVLLLIPGVTGSSEDNYIKVMCHNAQKRGYITVVVNALITKDTPVA